MDSRASKAVCGVGSFQMGGTNLDAPTFAVGYSYCAVGNKLSVGNYGLVIHLEILHFIVQGIQPF